MMLSLKESVDFGTVFYSRGSNGRLSDLSCDGEPRLREAGEAIATPCSGPGQSLDVPDEWKHGKCDGTAVLRDAPHPWVQR